MKIDTKSKKIEEVLSKGIKQILPDKEKLRHLMGKRKIRIYLGIDPTSSELHLGHTVPLRKLKQFQELGHEIILLFGTFTAQIGDPSGRDEKRKPLKVSQIQKNMLSYKKQVSKILDFSRVKIKYNDEWLSKLTFKDIIKLASNFTTSQLLERDMFQRRLERGREVWVSEFLYPLLQGYDSVAMNIDLEVGATDQTFNMLVGRKLQKIYNKKEKFILTTPILIGLDGRKMSKTFKNTVNLLDKPSLMYGKLMSLHDDLIIQYFELCTELPLAEIKKIKRDLKEKKINPRDLKARLAREIIAIYYNQEKAETAEREFSKVFKEKRPPSKIPKVKIRAKVLNILEILTKLKLASSRSEAKRLILQRGVRINGVLQKDWRKIIKVRKGQIFQVGKRKFVKID